LCRESSEKNAYALFNGNSSDATEWLPNSFSANEKKTDTAKVVAYVDGAGATSLKPLVHFF